MTDERLKEIKDSIDLQLEVANQLNVDDELTLEEKELYDYAEKLKNQLEHCYCNRTDCASRIKDSKKYDSIQQENEKLKRQLEYLKSGEYLNQLRFENEMLQQVIDTNGVPSEVYDYLESVHKNTEFLEQQQEFIKYLKDKEEFYKINVQFYSMNLIDEILQKYKEIIGGENER